MNIKTKKDEEYRKLLRNKLKYKRNFIFLMLSISWVYLSLTSAQDSDESFQPGPPFQWDNNYNIVGLDGDGDNSTNSSTNDTFRNCTPPAIYDFPPDLFTQEQRQSGFIFVHFLVSAYIFYAIAIVCDDYFVPSIECICDELNLPSDVGGATFMAIATSAPELFTNVIGTFITEGDIGIGTIVGSAVFNILAIAACCGLATKSGLQLEWWPLTRDCFFYSVSVILLILIVLNRQVAWYEALVLVLFYFVYIGVMYKNTAFKEAAEKLIFGVQRKHSHSHHHHHQNPEHEKTPLIDGSEAEKNNLEVDDDDDLGLSSEERDEVLIHKAVHQSELHAEEEKDELLLYKIPSGVPRIIEWILTWPIKFVFKYTIPDCREVSKRKYYFITFILCAGYIGGLTYFVSWMMTVIGFTFKIPDSVMGLTFIAAGTSVPEAVSSIIVSRQGLGAMGISNSIGSNTFDILICLGLPWLIRSSSMDFIHINSEGFEYTISLLIASLIILYTILCCNRFVLDKKVSFIALSLYAIFLVVSSMIELNVFFPVNLPSC